MSVLCLAFYSQDLAAQLKAAKAATKAKQKVAKDLEGQVQRLQAEMKGIMEVSGDAIVAEYVVLLASM